MPKVTELTKDRTGSQGCLTSKLLLTPLHRVRSADLGMAGREGLPVQSGLRAQDPAINFLG